MNTINVVSTKNAPEVLGPYSQAIRAGDFLFCSGQIPIDPSTQKIVEGDIKVQTQQVLKNLDAVLKEAGLDFSRVVKTSCFMKDLTQFGDFNAVYEEFLGASKPARATVEVSRLPKDVLIEIELIASF